MATHLRLLGALYLVWGGLGVLLGTAMLVLAAGAVAVARAPVREGTELAAALTALLLAATGVVLAAGGGAHVWTGVALGRRRRPARLAGLALALANLFFFPAGTALGFYSCWVLLSDETRRRFEGEV